MICHICNHTFLQGLEYVHAGLPLKREHLSYIACRFLGALALTSFSSSIVMWCRLNCWIADVNGLTKCVLVQQDWAKGFRSMNVSLQFSTCFHHSGTENYCWQLISPENYNCKCEWKVIKWRSVRNVSLIQRLLHQTQLISTQKKEKKK